jgi:hypothetical protein
MCMNWMGCLNHIIHHNPSEKPAECPTATFHCETQHIQLGFASIQHPATVTGAETLYICMKWTCYEYEAGRVPQLNLQHITSEKPSECPNSTFHCETKHISDWGCIHMTLSIVECD